MEEFLQREVYDGYTVLQVGAAAIVLLFVVNFLLGMRRHGIGSRKKTKKDKLISAKCPSCGWKGKVSRYTRECPQCGSMSF